MSDFEQWFGGSKYTQVVYPSAATKQIALDGWNAAIASMQGVAVDAGELERLRNSDVLLTDVINWLKERDLYHDADYFGEGPDLAAILSTHESECIGKDDPIAYIRLSDLIDLTQSDQGKLKIKHIFNNPSKEHNARPLFTYPPSSASKIAEQDADNARLKAENETLYTTMMAAAVEIQEHWDAHCDAEGYGPANLMHRLESGIASRYGYDAKTVVNMEAEIARLQKELEEARKDSERYRWLRAEAKRDYIEFNDRLYEHDADLDEAIDAAIGKIGGGE